MRELVAAGGFVGAAQYLEAAGTAIPVNGLLEVGDANAGMIECNGHGRSFA